MGLAFASTGWLYPLFGTLLGWLGVAVTGSDTASNVLFGGLQKVTAQQLGLNPVLMAAANSSGGVMGKMIDAQSIVVASTATKWYGHEGSILRYVFFHSIALAVPGRPPGDGAGLRLPVHPPGALRAEPGSAGLVNPARRAPSPSNHPGRRPRWTVLRGPVPRMQRSCQRWCPCNADALRASGRTPTAIATSVA